MTYPQPPTPKAAVRRAGKRISKEAEHFEDLNLVDNWRASHGYVINTFQAWLKGNLSRIGVQAEFAQRLKRRKTVINKLRRKRPDGTFLISDVTSMHDFAGCRLIFDSIEDLNRFRAHIRSSKVLANVNHTFKNPLDKFDYIKKPKPTGYRGIHEILVHNPRPHRRGDTSADPWRNLLSEIQLRTKVQHAWATALEISDVVDREQTKFELHETKRSKFFSIASEVFARQHEESPVAFPEASTKQLFSQLDELEAELGILRRLGALAQFGGFDRLGKHNVLNIAIGGRDELHLEVYHFKSPSRAIEKANALESDLFSLNAVYVRADNPQQLASAYRNYFQDPKDFVRLIEEARLCL